MEKSSLKYYNFQKPAQRNCPIGENSLNLVTLPEMYIHTYMYLLATSREIITPSCRNKSDKGSHLHTIMGQYQQTTHVGTDIALLISPKNWRF
jgi:hypothetical protein